MLLFKNGLKDQKKSVLSVEFHERNEGNSGLHSWGSGVSSRIDNRERREAVFVDGFLSPDGIPIGVEGRGSAEEWKRGETIISKGTQRKLSFMYKYRLFSVAYILLFFFIGIVLQGWFI